MYWIAIALVLAAPRPAAQVPESAPPVLGIEAADRCAAARAVAEMPPCLDAASCRAVDAWSDLVAPPGPRLAPGPAGPRVAADPAGPRFGPDPPAVPRPIGRLPGVCLAGPR